MLSKFLDYPVKFVFINSKGRALINSSLLVEPNTNHESDPIGLAIKAKGMYEIQIRRNFGLGFVKSFIPGNQAFTARKEYFSSLQDLHENLEKKLEHYHHDDSLRHHLSLTPLFFLKNFLTKFDEIFENLPYLFIANNKEPIDLINYLPIISDLFPIEKENEKSEKGHKELLHSLINPFRLGTASLRFLHHLIDLIIELGANPFDLSFIRIGLKLLIAWVFIPSHLLMAFLECTADLSLELFDTIVFDPIRFIFEVLSQSSEDSLDYFYVPTSEFQGVINIMTALNKPNKPLYLGQSKNLTLCNFSAESKEKFIEESQFYQRVNQQPCFKNTNNFANLATNELLILSLFSQWKKIREFALVAKQKGGPMPDIYKILTKHFIETIQIEASENKEEIKVSI